MREGILDFVFDLLRHAEESAYLYELSVLLQAMAADTFDELFVISVLLDSITHSQVCSRLQTLVVNHPDTIKAVSFPQYILYLLFARNRASPLNWPSKYAMVQLLDAMFNSSQVAINYILASDLKLNGSVINTVEYYFSLVDSPHTHALGVALILLLVRTATSTPSLTSAFGQIMNIFIKSL